MVPGINTPVQYRMQAPSPDPKIPEAIPKDTTNNLLIIPPNTIKYHPMSKKYAKAMEHVTIVERSDTSPVIVTKSQEPKIIIKGTTSEEMEEEEELREDQNLAIPTIPRKKPTIPSKLPIHPTM